MFTENKTNTIKLRKVLFFPYFFILCSWLTKINSLYFPWISIFTEFPDFPCTKTWGTWVWSRRVSGVLPSLWPSSYLPYCSTVRQIQVSLLIYSGIPRITGCRESNYTLLLKMDFQDKFPWKKETTSSVSQNRHLFLSTRKTQHPNQPAFQVAPY